MNTNTTTAVQFGTLKELCFDSPPPRMTSCRPPPPRRSANEKWLFAVQGSFNWAMLPFIWTLGGSITDDDFTTATGHLNSEATVKALETIKAWMDEKIISTSVLGEEPGTWGGIEAGNYAMVVEGPWFYSAGEAKPNFPSAPIPAYEGRSISIVGGEDLVMLKGTQHQEAAWTFMKFMLREEALSPLTTRHYPHHGQQPGQGGYFRVALDGRVSGAAENCRAPHAVRPMALHRRSAEHRL
jgi:multiple sugar transport system substrate-binding protein